jgi:lantibiotic modifying enzyme
MTPFAEAAVGIAQRLARDAVPTAAGVTWHGPVLVSDAADYHVQDGDCGADLYGGAAGIALFLAGAARLDTTGDVAEAAACGAAEALARAPKLWHDGRVGLLDGVTGIALSAVTVGRLLGRAGLAAHGHQMAEAVAKPLRDGADPAEHDVTSGTAGVLLGLLALESSDERLGLLAGCRTAARRLAAAGKYEAWGRSWPSPHQPSEPALLGMAHGAAGVALALAEVAKATGEDQLGDAVKEAHRYERSWFSAEQGNWPDLREPDPADAAAGRWPGWPAYWCHGALGIGMARLRVHQLTGDRTPLAEASVGVQAARDLTVRAGTALRQGQTTDACLCHGLSAAAELLLMAGHVLDAPEHIRAAQRVGYLLLEEADHSGGRWPCGLRDAGELPGLFLGLAGIGLALLRLHSPTLAPSPLLPGPGGGWGT